MEKRDPVDIMGKLENDIGLLKYKTEDGIPVYLIAKKYLLFDKVMPHFFDVKTAGFLSNDRKINSKAFMFMAKACVHNILCKHKVKKSKIVIYAASRPTLMNGKYVNRYTDFLADVKKNDTLTIEDTAVDWTWPEPRHNDKVIYDGAGMAAAHVLSIFTYKKNIKSVEPFLEYFNERLYATCDFRLEDDELNDIAIQLARDISIMRFRTKWLDRHIPKTAKLVIMLGGSYPMFYPVNRMLKKRNIVTADIQHGFITKNNLVYSYPENLINSDEVKLGSTDYFLTYGEWWNSQILNPTEKVVIGNPYRDYCISSLSHKGDRKRILLVGCEVNTEKYIQWTFKLSQLLPEYEVVFRPHPGEKAETTKIINRDNVHIVVDPENEIYRSLFMSSFVISEVSTVLYEAIGICEHIIVLSTEYSRARWPEHPFESCDSIEEIAEKIIDNGFKTGEISSEAIWAKDYKTNYINFVERWS